MALDANTIWELRTDGDPTNGGGFNATRDAVTGVDYSQQAAAQLSLTDCYCHNDPVLHSDTGGFTHAMEGNIVHINSGTHFTVGWYEITTYVSTNEVVLDRTPVTEDNSDHKDGAAKVGGACEFGSATDANLLASFVPGNICYIRGGDHAPLGENASSSVSGTAALPIRIVGYETNRAARPTGDNRPLIQCGASYYFGTGGSFVTIENLRFTGSASYVVYCSGSSESVLNCKATNSSATANRSAFYGPSGVYLIGCEGISTNGYAFNNGYLIHCYAHDSVSGFIGASHTLFCIADTCSTYGISQASGITMNCTAYNCGTNLYLSAATALSVAINNILDAGTTGIDASAAKESTILAFNSFDNTSDLAANVDGSIQIENQTGDPGLGDPANGDFRITSADSEVYQLGLDVQVYTGATVR